MKVLGLSIPFARNIRDEVFCLLKPLQPRVSKGRGGGSEA